MFNNHSLYKVIAFSFLALFIMAGCGSTTATPNTTPDAVNIQLSWVHEYSSAPFYVAEKNGHYTAQNLTVQLVEGGFTDGKYIDAIDQVVSGAVDFGMSDASSLLAAQAAGKPVVGIMTIMQRSPLAIITLDNSTIQRPQDLVGKTVAVSEGGAQRVLTSMLLIQNIDPATINIVARTTFGVDPLINGEVDALVGWTINEGVQVREAGQEPKFLLISDYGIDTYDFVLFTTEKTLADKADIVTRVLNAVLGGLQDTIASPEKAIDNVLLYGTSLDRTGQQARLSATIPLINPPGIKLGTMNDDTWKITAQVLIDQSVIPSTLDYKTAFDSKIIDSVSK